MSVLPAPPNGSPVANINITYNLLNLPQTITGGKTITYTYDANGNKLRRVSPNTGSTDYINGIQYDQSIGATVPTLSFIQTEDGKAVPPLSSCGYDYYYYLSDNLGNTQVTFDTKTDTTVVLQQDDYMPFGYEISRGTVTSPKNEYLYNKKELQEELVQYDYGARFYDPVIARWTALDLLAEVAPSLTPYRYCYNNPINFTDPFGLWETDANGNQTTNKKEDIERFMSYLDAESAIKTTPTISQISTFVGEEKAGGLGKLTDGSKLLNPINIQQYNTVGGGHGYNVDQKSFSNFWYQVQGDLTPNDLDPRTWHNNNFLGIPNGLSFAGDNNLKTYRGIEDYSHMPDQIEDVPAYYHDLDFNNLKVSGPGAVFNDPKTQSANAKLVKAEIQFSLMPGLSPVTKARAIIIAVGIGAADSYNIIKNSPPDSGAPPIDP